MNLKKHKDVEVELIFRSFFIKAQANEGWEDFLEFNELTWGGDEWTKELFDKGRNMDVNMQTGNIGLIPLCVIN